MTARQVMNEAVERLTDAGAEEASNDAWLLFSAAFGMDRTSYLIHADEPLTDAKAQADFDDMIKRRTEHEPVQYIIGSAWFMGYEFTVSPAVLIPRFDTEVLVENALKRAHEGMRILDVCTGSGCIAISLALNVHNSVITASDVSADALSIAAINRTKLHADNVTLIESDMFDKITGRYDMIVSNPPYIRTKDIEELQTEVKDKEPYMALNGHEDGLFFYRILTAESPAHLVPGGIICLETGCDQADSVCELLHNNHFTDIEVIKDLSGLDRVVLGRRI